MPFEAGVTGESPRSKKPRNIEDTAGEDPTRPYM
jgi:hypothetical protein